MRPLQPMTPYEMVREFHSETELPIAPGLINLHGRSGADTALRELRFELLREEYREYVEAERADDIVEVADALADMQYIINGTALSYGFNLDLVFAEVHRSNMSKRMPDGSWKRREDGKILKGPLWTPPNIAGVICE